MEVSTATIKFSRQEIEQLIEGEQQTNGHLSQEDFYGNVCKNCE